MNPDDVHLSKCLSWLLRHGAVKENLPISSEGFIPLDIVLHHRSLKQYTKEDIFRVVNTNDKQRFTLKCIDGDKWKIKANQGHSIEQIEDTELTPITQSIYKTVVHGTYYKYWPQIKLQGLSRMKRNHIHFAKGFPQDYSVISRPRTNTEILIYINLQKALSESLKFFESANGVILTRGDNRGYLHTKYFEKVVDAHTGFPDSSTRSDLKLLFSRYGSVTVEYMNGKMAILRFTDPNSVAQVVIDRGIYLHRHHLRIQAYALSANEMRNKRKNIVPKRDFTRSKQKNAIIEPNELVLTGDFHDQLDALLTAVRLNQQEVTELARLYTDIEMVLQEQWPGCVTYPFGSITTGLGIKSSDADCYVSGAERGDQSNLSVNKARRLFEARSDLFTEILAIPRANTPIVKLFHLPTQTNCDISFKTPLGTQNSKLIAFLLRSDPRLIPISVVIKYWAKIHGLSGSGRMSNYALTMLVIFYLQQPPLNILPAVHSLQKQVTQHQMVDGWNTGFAETHLPDATHDHRQHSIPHLLAGFFQFYATFDFNKYVVCPYLGRPIEKALFDKPDSLPEEFALYKINVSIQRSLPLKISSALCVQDPFEQCHNVASTISNLLAAEIKAYFKFASDMHEKDELDNYKNFLKQILLEKPILEELRGRKKNKKTTNLRLKFKSELNVITNPDWMSVVRKAIYLMFEKMMQIKLTKVKDDAETQELGKDKYKGVITRAIWKRGQYERLYKFMKYDYLDRIERITTEIMQIDKNKINLPINVRLFFQKDVKCCQIFVKLSNKTIPADKELFKQFVMFGKNELQHWFVNLLRVCNTDTEYNISEENGDCDGSYNTSEDSDSEHDKEQPKIWYNTKQSATNININKNSDTSVKVTKSSDADTKIPKNNNDNVESTSESEKSSKKVPQSSKINKQSLKKVCKNIEGNVSLLSVRKIDPDTIQPELNQNTIDQIKTEPSTSKDTSNSDNSNQEQVTKNKTTIGSGGDNTENVSQNSTPKKKRTRKRDKSKKSDSTPTVGRDTSKNIDKLTEDKNIKENSGLVKKTSDNIDKNSKNSIDILDNTKQEIKCTIIKRNSNEFTKSCDINTDNEKESYCTSTDPIVDSCISIANLNINDVSSNITYNMNIVNNNQNEIKDESIVDATNHNNCDNVAVPANTETQ